MEDQRKGRIMQGINEVIGKENLLKKLIREGVFKLPACDKYALYESIEEWRNEGAPGTLAEHLACTTLAETYSLETLLQAASADQ